MLPGKQHVHVWNVNSLPLQILSSRILFWMMNRSRPPVIAESFGNLRHLLHLGTEAVLRNWTINIILLHCPTGFKLLSNNWSRCKIGSELHNVGSKFHSVTQNGCWQLMWAKNKSDIYLNSDVLNCHIPQATTFPPPTWRQFAKIAPG